MIEWCGIDTLYWFQSVRESIPFLEDFFLAVSSSPVYLALPMMIACAFYWMVDKRKGEVILLSFVPAMVFTKMAKFAIDQPRPWDIDSNIDRVPRAKIDGPACPSGHTTISTSAFGSIALVGNNRKLTVVMVVLIILVINARLFLCVHTPLDVTVGLIVGIAAIIVSWKAVELSYRNDAMFYLVELLYGAFFTCIFILAILVWDAGRQDVLTDIGFVYGLLLGRALEHKYLNYEPKDYPNKEKILRYCAGMLVGATLLLAPAYFFHAIGACVGAFLIMLWSVFLYPRILTRSS